MLQIATRRNKGPLKFQLHATGNDITALALRKVTVVYIANAWRHPHGGKGARDGDTC